MSKIKLHLSYNFRDGGGFVSDKQKVFTPRSYQWFGRDLRELLSDLRLTIKDMR